MTATASDTAAFEEIWFTTRDGLRLYARHYRAARKSRQRPVLCLAGLTRNSRDFHVIATALSKRWGAPRDVYTLDTRGRGLSDHDPDWKNYTVPIEMLDAVDFLTSRGLADVAVIGTSRGGLIAMVMAAAQPGTIGTVVLNDIGPVVETAGLLRISGYVGRTPTPASWEDAGRITRSINERQFPKISDAEWVEVARQWFNEKAGRPAPSYDPAVGRSLSVLEGPMPPLWAQFGALERVPVMVLRGDRSDILSAATVEEMQRRHTNLTTFIVPDQGHPPLLRDEASISSIARFLDEAG
ncbi:MAG: alpha/beta fold hydrolase [Hyphomicrobiaceae bacterium]